MESSRWKIGSKHSENPIVLRYAEVTEVALLNRMQIIPIFRFLTISQRRRSLQPMQRTRFVRTHGASIKAKFHYAIWSQTGPKLFADLLARAR